MSARQATIAGLCILAISAIAVVVVFSESSPSVSMSVIGFRAEQWPDDLVQKMGSRDYIVVSVELTNRSNKAIKYFGGANRSNVFSGLWYKMLGKWQPPANADFCGTGIEEWALAPMRSVVFEAMVDRDRPCKVAVSVSDGGVTSRLSRRLPAWIAQRLPWIGEWDIVTTEAIDLHGAPGLTAKPRESLTRQAEEFSTLLAMAQRDDEGAQFRLAGRYWSGNGVAKNAVDAIRWYEAAALKGHAEAAYTLGTIHDFGLVVDSDKTKAKEWYRKASELGHSEARDRLKVLSTDR